ncbi:MAG: transglutaminase domain-containing protein [Verrucomicrobiae bacterium]|nr:transglutaminase domain-containing protein [Verrucomicrobiae bacterium]
MNRWPAILLLTVVLLIEAYLSHAVTGVSLHQTLLLAAFSIFLLIRWGGPRFARFLGGVITFAFAFGGWRMLETGLVPITLSELPFGFHLAMGIHLWMWMRAIGGRKERFFGFGNISGLLNLAAGALVIWTVGVVEIYGNSILSVRFLSLVVMAISLGVIWRYPVQRSRDEVIMKIDTREASGIFGLQKSWQFPGMAVGIVAAMLFLAWSMTIADRAALLSYEWLGRDGEVTELEGFGNDQALPLGAGSAIDGAMRQLPKKADIRLDDGLRFFIGFDEDEQFAVATGRTLYLRTSTMAHFTADGRMGPRRSGQWIYDSDDEVEDGVTVLTETEGAHQSMDLDYWALIRHDDATGLPLMPTTRTVGLSGVYVFADDWYQLALEPHQDRVRFQARSTLIDWRELRDREGLEKGDAPVDYLQLPDTGLTDRLLATVREVAPTDWSLSRRLEGIQNYLASQCAYSLKYENPDNLDPVENFLYGERLGHCELYAATTAMLVRGIGVPSRVAFGFSGGESNASRRLIAFRQSDYHAWAEIYLKDHGWVIFETTPDGMGSAVAATENPESWTFATIELERYENLGEERLLGQVEVSRFSRLAALVNEAVAKWFPAICGLAALVMSILLGVRWKKMIGQGGSGSSTARTSAALQLEASASNLLNDYLRTCAALGRAKSPSETLNELLRSLKEDGLCGDELDEINAYLYRVRYAGGDRDSTRERDYRKRLDSLVAARAESQLPL